VALAWLYIVQYHRISIQSDDYLDSALFLVDMALAFDNQLAWAYQTKGYCLTHQGKPDQAFFAYDKAIKCNPNNMQTYRQRAMLFHYNDDLLRAISDWHKGISLSSGVDSERNNLGLMLSQLSQCYSRAGFYEKAKYYIREALILSNDSTSYYYNLSWAEYYTGNLRAAVEWNKKAIGRGSGILLEYRFLRRMGQLFMLNGQFEESLRFYERSIECDQSILGPFRFYTPVGFVFRMNGYEEKAEYCFNEQIEFSNRIIELDREHRTKYMAFYYLAGAYACLGHIDKAYENLHNFNQRPRMCLWEVHMINNDPVFDSIRDEPEFQRIILEIEEKYQVEHERVKMWLEENDML